MVVFDKVTVVKDVVFVKTGFGVSQGKRPVGSLVNLPQDPTGFVEIME